MDQVVFAVNNFLVVLVCVLACDIFMKDRPVWRRLLAIVAAYPAVILLDVLFLGSFGILSAAWAPVLPAGAAVALAMYRRVVRRNQTIPANAGSEVCECADRGRVLWFVVLLVAGCICGLAAGRFVLSGTHFISDDLSYHGPAGAHWLVNKYLSVTPFNGQAHFPLNAEVLSLWFMLPFGSDGLVSLAGVYWLTLAFLSVIVLVLEQGLGTSAAKLAAVSILASRRVISMATTFSAVDLAGAAMVLAATAFGISSCNDSTDDKTIAEAGYCGLGCGFAMGCKATFLPVVIVLFCWLAFAGKNRLAPSVRVKRLILFALCAVVTGSYWYVRNIILTGNPLFPAAFGPFGGPFSSEAQYRTKLIHWIFASPLDIDQWLYLLKRHISWPVQIFLLSFIGYMVAIYSILRRKRPVDDGQADKRIIIVIIGLTLLLVYPLMPFSTIPFHPGGPLRISLRFVVTPFIIGIVLFAQLLAKSGFRGWFWRVTVIIALVSGWYLTRNALIAAVALAIAAGAAGAAYFYIRKKFGRIFFPVWARWSVLWAFIPAGLLTLSLCMPYQQQQTDARIHQYKPKGLGKPLKEIETLPEGAHLTYFGPLAFQYYPLFGRRFQFVPCKVSRDGSAYVPLYQRWLKDPENTFWWEAKEEDKPPVSDSLIDNLAGAGVDYVLTAKLDNGRWPQQQGVLEDSGRVRKISGGQYWTIWDITDSDGDKVTGGSGR